MSGEGLTKLMSLLPERDRRFKRKRYGPVEILGVDVQRLVIDWLNGVDLGELAAAHLADVAGAEADAFRFEQLSSFLAKVCEHHLPWTVGILIDWIQELRDVTLCPDLPAYLHHGVPDAVSLALMRGGVRSRRVAVAVGARAALEGVDSGSVRAWLGGLGLAAWRVDFDAAPAELADLLQFARLPGANVGQLLLGGAEVAIEAQIVGVPAEAATLGIGFQAGVETPAPLVASDDGGETQAEVSPSMYAHLAVLVEAGFRLTGRLVDVVGQPTLYVKLVEE